MTALTGLASLYMNRVEAQDQNEKRRMTILLAGVMCGVVVVAVMAGYAFWGFRESNPSWWLVIPVIVLGVLFPLSFVYAVLKHRVFGIRMILRRGIRYLLASRASYIMAAALIFTALYLTIGAATFQLQVSATPGFGWRLAAIAALAFALSMAVPKMNRRIMP